MPEGYVLGVGIVAVIGIVVLAVAATNYWSKLGSAEEQLAEMSDLYNREWIARAAAEERERRLTDWIALAVATYPADEEEAEIVIDVEPEVDPEPVVRLADRTEDLEIAAELRREGATWKEIGELLEVADSTARRIVTKFSVSKVDTAAQDL